VPAYYYQCTHCQVTEYRIGGVDDHLAICARCHHLMLRLDYDLFSPYFVELAGTVTPRRPRTQGQSQKNN
jgi:hypothetical protein